jgi:ribosomal protein S18 acetylase RimI-like enzyme
MSDTDRFQAWQRDRLADREDGAEMLSVGPFRAVLSGAGEAAQNGWAVLVDGTAAEAETLKALTKLRSTFKRHKVPLEIEYNEALFPKVGEWLEGAGLKLIERNSLMSCRPEGFKPFATPEEVHLTQLSSAAAAAELEAFQTIRWTDGGEIDRPPPPIERLRADIARPNSVFLLAWLKWEPAGTGVSHSLKGAGEIVGVVTRQDRRRRGVAAAITSELVRRHFTNGGDFVFLDAASEDAARVYERLGFTPFGANLVYR